MITADLNPTQQPISPRSLHELLGVDAPSYEALGSGVRDALSCLRHASDFYALPEWLGPDLDAFEYHLREALKALHRGDDLALGMLGE